MSTEASAIIWIGVRFQYLNDYKDFFDQLPEEVRVAITSRGEYKFEGLTFREFKVAAEMSVGFGVEYYRHRSDKIVSFTPMFAKKSEIGEIRSRVKEIMDGWGITEMPDAFWQVCLN